jgi:hypothetical protein
MIFGQSKVESQTKKNHSKLQKYFGNNLRRKSARA